MRLVMDPPMDRWQPRERPAVGVIATGHQPWLWHPGILAKYVAAGAFARSRGLRAAHVVVDTDLIAGLTLDVPVLRGRRLGVHRVRLASVRVDRPTVVQPAVDARQVTATLEAVPDRVEGRVAVDLSPLIHAWRDLPPAANLAAQISDVLERLMLPWTGPLERIYASELLRSEAGRALVTEMVRDAHRCALTYNRAAASVPEARIRPLHVGVDVVELPLWSITPWGRQPIFVERAASDAGELMAGIDTGTLAPRALLLSALMRRERSDLFIHGRGGGVYDRVTEAWWTAWRGEVLAPMAVVSADVYLDFDAPLADEAQLQRAQWYAHHLPGNIDRVLKLDGRDGRVARKREILAHMDDDRDKRRRAKAFVELQAINAELGREHGDLLTAARQAVADARLGVANRDIALRREWCFALYPREKLDALVRSLVPVAVGADYRTTGG